MSSHLYPPGFEPPYYYNDPRITYDEECFLYNGGFDEVCLIDNGLLPTKKGGAGGGGVMVAMRRPYVPPPAPNPLLDLTIKVCLVSVNKTDTGSICSQVKWTREIVPRAVESHLSSAYTAKRFVYSSLVGTQKPERELSAELTGVEPVEKKMSVSDISVSSPGPVIKVTSPIKKSLIEHKITIGSKTTSTNDQVLVYLKKPIIVTPNKKK